MRVGGELDLSTSQDLADAIESAALDHELVLLDLGEVTFIDSAGIRVIAGEARSLDGRGVRLRIVATSPRAERLLRMTGVLDGLGDPS